MLLLADNRAPRSPGLRPTWRLTALRLSWRLAVGMALLLVSSAFTPVEAYALIIAACVLIARGLAIVVLDLPDLTERRR